MLLLSSLRWFILNSAQYILIKFQQTLLATYIAGGFNIILPGALGGDLIRLMYVFKKAPEQKSLGFLTLFADRVIGFMAILVILCVISLIDMQSFRESSTLFYLTLMSILLCFAAFIFLMCCIWISQQKFFQHYLNRHLEERPWAKPFLAFFSTLRIFHFKKITLLYCLAISVLIQILITSSVIVIAKILGFKAISFEHYLIAMSITQIVNLLPITPGGVGIGELAFGNVLMILNPGLSLPYATIFFAYRILTMLAYLPGVIIFIPKFLFKKNEPA
jgi:uncharacterized protein (TIRG00374 family)